MQKKNDAIKKSRTKSFIKRTLYSLLLLVILVGAGYYTALQYLKSDAGRQQIVKQIEKVTGREVALGNLGLAVGLKPTVEINNLRIDNAEWGTAEDFLKVDKAIVTAQLLPMLQKEIILEKITLVGADINLEKNKEGDANWVFSDKTTEKGVDEEEAKKTAVSLNLIAAENVNLSYSDAQTGKKHSLTLQDMKLNEGLTNMTLKLNGSYQKKPLSLDIETATVKEFMQKVSEIPVKGNVQYAGNNLDVDVLTVLPANEKPLSFTARVSGKVQSVPAEIYQVPEKYKGFFPITMSVNVAGTENKADLKNLSINATGATLKANSVNIGMKPLGGMGDLNLTLQDAGLFIPQLKGEPLTISTNLNYNNDVLKLRNLKLDSTGIDITGKNMNIGTKPLKASGSIKANIEKMGRFAEALKDKSLELDTSLQYADNVIKTENMTAKLGENLVRGQATVNLKPEPIGIRFDLAADDIYLHDILPKNQAINEAKPAEEEKPTLNKSGKLFSSKPMDLSILSKIKLNAKADIKNLHLEEKDTSKNVYKNIILSANIQNGQASIENFAAALPGGANINGQGGINENGALRLKFLVDNMILGSFLNHWTGNTLIQNGRTVTRIDLTANGKSPAALAASANGSAELVVKDAKIQSGYVNLLADDLVQNIIPFARKATGLTQVNCIVSRWPITNGVAETDITLIDTQQISIAGKGSINLGKETLDIRLIPSPKSPSLVSLSAPIIVSGTFTKPKFRPDTAKVATDVLKAAALGAINPLAIALPYLSAGGDKDPCDNVLDGMQINLKQASDRDVEKALGDAAAKDTSISNTVQEIQEGDLSETLQQVTPELLQQSPKKTLDNLEKSGKNILDGLESGVKNIIKLPGTPATQPTEQPADASPAPEQETEQESVPSD